MMNRLLIMCMLISFYISSYAQRHNRFSDIANAESEIGVIMKQLDVIGLSVAVVNDGELVYTHSFGYKDIGYKNSATKQILAGDDLFRIASISKTFVATAIMQLVEKNKISLDDDVNTHLNFNVRNPKYPDTPITLRMLLSHRSSINDNKGYYSFDAINPKKGTDYFSCYNDYQPGVDYQYCNLNYNLLGAVIENVSGERFDIYISNHITKPLDLKCSFNINALDSTLFVTTYKYDEVDKRLKPSLVTYKAYEKEMFDYVLGYSTPYLAPASGMKITTDDLARYMIMHINSGKYGRKKIISSNSESEMRKILTKTKEYGLSYRKYVSLLPGYIMYGQTGGAYGVFSAMIFCPQSKFGFVVITNGCLSKSIDGYADLHTHVIRALYKNFIQ